MGTTPTDLLAASMAGKAFFPSNFSSICGTQTDTLRPFYIWAKANAKAKKIQEQSEEIKKIQTSKKIFAFAFVWRELILSVEQTPAVF